MKYIFLVNKFSLKNETKDVIDRIKTTCERLKLDYIIEENSSNISTEDICCKYESGSNVLIAIGGDGTINRVLNGIVNTKNILGFIPYGTGNDFYKTTREDLENGINTIDLIRINEKYFINIACFGIDADIANESDIIHSKLIPKSQRYNVGIIYHFIKYKARYMKIIIDSQEYENEWTTVAVCNAKYYGGGYKISPKCSLDDGLVEVYMADKMPKIKMAKTIMSMKDGSHEKSKHVKKVLTNKLLIESNASFACNIDGEDLVSDHFDIEVIPKGMKIYYNQELIDGISRVRKKI